MLGVVACLCVGGFRVLVLTGFVGCVCSGLDFCCLLCIGLVNSVDLFGFMV